MKRQGAFLAYLVIHETVQSKKKKKPEDIVKAKGGHKILQGETVVLLSSRVSTIYIIMVM